MTLLVCCPPLLKGGRLVLSSADTDLAMQFLPWRDFGFSELRRGHLALWNPHVFSGTPFFGAFESALLYPPNWLHLLLPLGSAVNAVIILHVFLAGLFVFFWARRGGAGLTASAAAGSLYMFSGPFFLHIYAGHVPPLCVMAWAPALFCAIDGWAEGGGAPWLLAGMFAVAMQVLAGNPQYAYYTALFAGLYALAVAPRLKGLGGLGAMYAGGAALAAVQLLAGLQAASESVRAGGVAYGFAATFSLPPENIPTLLAPDILGGLYGFPYFGQWYFWEAVIFVGVTGVFLACAGDFGKKGNRAAAVLCLVALLLALGDNTPLFGFLYRFVPGYNLFRGTAKISFLAVLFASRLAASGFDRLAERTPSLKISAAAALTALFAAAGSIFLAHSVTGLGRFLASLGGARSIHLPASLYHDPGFARGAAAQAGSGLAACAGAFGAIALLTGLMMFSRRFVYGLAALALLESAVFARGHLATMRMELAYPSAWKQALDGRGDSRVLHDAQSFPNAAMKLGADDVWGYGSFVLRRYAEFMAFSQGVDPRFATQYLTFKRFPGILSILRCRYAFIADGRQTILSLPRPLPRVQLVSDWRVRTGRDDILKSLFDPMFDPRSEILLEKEPTPAPDPRSPVSGKAEVVASTTDSLDIKAEVARASILLMTDPYSRGWRAVSLGVSPQPSYEVIPADYILRAVPLAAGRHHIRVEYAPSGFLIGRWISILALLLYLPACWLHLRPRRK